MRRAGPPASAEEIKEQEDIASTTLKTVAAGCILLYLCRRLSLHFVRDDQGS